MESKQTNNKSSIVSSGTVVRGSTLVAKVEEALQHRTRTIDFTLSAINGHARVLRRSRCSRGYKEICRCCCFSRTHTIKVGTLNKYNYFQKLQGTTL